MPDDYPSTDRSTVRRLAERGSHDRALIRAVLDEARICHVGFVHDGTPIVIPTIHGRVDDTLYLHGSAASRMLRTLREGVEVAVSVALVDGIVLARSLFNHSMNYRSVVVFGTTRLVDDPAERDLALRAITEHLLPGRWDDARQANDRENRATMVVAVPIAEASSKVRVGPPGDDVDDLDLPLWAGVVPLRTVAGPPQAAPNLAEGIPLPPYLEGFSE